MKLGRIAITTGLATVMAAAAFAAPAQAEEYCFGEEVPKVGGSCFNTDDPVCVRAVCVEGVGENVEGARRFVSEQLDNVEDLVPERICTPVLFGSPICVTNG